MATHYTVNMQSQRFEIDEADDPAQPPRASNTRWVPIGIAALLGALAIGAAGFTLYKSSPLNASTALRQAPASLVIQKANIDVPRVQRIDPAPAASALPVTEVTAQPTPALTHIVKSTAAPLAISKQLAVVEGLIEPKPSSEPQVSCPKPVGQIVTHTLSSKITAAPITVNVYLPPCYNASEHSYPTLYLIHGTAFEQGGWIFDGLPRVADIGMSLGTLPPFIIVMPGADMRAGDASKYAWTNSGDTSYEGFVVNELVPFIDGKYSTWANREGRAIGGISRGGYWSIEIGFSNPDTFSTVGGHSPSVFSQLVGMPDNFSMLSTAKSINALHSLRIWLDAGDTDWARGDMNKLTGDLDKAGVSYQSSVGTGTHEDAYWTSRVPDYLAYYAKSWPIEAHVRQTSGNSASIDVSR